MDASTQAKYIMSPGFPGSYPEGLDCVWTITAPQDKKIFAVVEEMDMEYSYDYLYMGKDKCFSFLNQYVLKDRLSTYSLCKNIRSNFSLHNLS